jgi:ACS family tartrate transporter-like MFS transporter
MQGFRLYSEAFDLCLGMQIPSNVSFIYLGGPLMLGCIAVGWGLVASSMAAVTNTSTFLTVRFLLGIAEAGTVPGGL